MRKPPRIRLAKPLVKVADHRTVRPPPKRADPELLTPEHRAWRLAVLRAAHWRCQWPGCDAQGGQGGVILIADHIVERSDDGALYDPANGQALCKEHHALKSADARARRHGLR